MPEKKDPYRSYGQKLISLFAKLLFSQEKYSLIELAKLLDCSKQTVMRLISDIQMSYGVEIEETTEDRRKYYKLKQLKGSKPLLPLTSGEIWSLQMCKHFTEHLLGTDLFEETSNAIEKSSLLSGQKALSNKQFASYHPGSVDYTPFGKLLRTIARALDERKICKIIYQPILSKNEKSYSVAPLKLFSHNDTIYLHGRKTKNDKEDIPLIDSSRLFVVHRMKDVQLTEEEFSSPENYNFEEFLNQTFGIIKEEESFEVTIEFSDFAAAYVSERTWSPNQEITWLDHNRMQLTCMVSSEPEVIGWILSWGEKAKLLEPDWLVEELENKIKNMGNRYLR
nr:WYL domain-containing protein [Desulfobulbaceae bacterium]